MKGREAELAEHMERVASELRRRARHGVHEGRETPEMWRYLRHCRAEDHRTGTRLIFTRDTGHHTSGWLKNPDYERCWHLSTSPIPGLIVIPGQPQLAELDKGTRAAWVKAFYGEDVRYVWSEGPKTPEGRAHDVWHWRLFCDEHWVPLLPRKEVYTREFTEEGWRSASQVLAEDGFYRLETEDGRTIETVVDAT